jgi:hypothetical protein
MLARPRALAARSIDASLVPAPLIEPPRFCVDGVTSARLPVVFG